jgi:hypothetical protein
MQLLLFAKIASADDKLHAKVIVAGDSGSNSLIESYITEELRSLGDVEISEPSADIIFIVTYKRPEVTGLIFISYVFVTLESRSSLTFESILGSGFSGSLNDLKEMCSMIVAEFDTYNLENRRKRQKNL